jgi:hypothetical protein
LIFPERSIWFVSPEKRERQRVLDDLLAHLARERSKRWYREALAFARSFNTRPLVDRTEQADAGEEDAGQEGVA